MEILETLWKLRTDPFYPTIDAEGNPIVPEAIEQTLDPLLDERVVQYYFDLYDWTASELIHTISRDCGLATFPAPRDLPRKAALMVLISGSMQTGRDSLANLVLHKVKLTAGHLPLIVDVQLEGRNRAVNLALVADRIVTKFWLDREPVHDKPQLVQVMREEKDRAKKEAESQSSAIYANLFTTFNDLLEPLKRQVILRIIGGGDNDDWVRIYNTAGRLCSYIIVMTSNRYYAQTCFDQMNGTGNNIAWVHSRELDRASARKYLRERLAAERLDGAAMTEADALLPFTPEAIEALYEPGDTARSGEMPRYAIGWLRRTFARALQERLAEIAQQRTTLPPHEFAALDPHQLCIQPNQLRSARERLNRGG